MKLRPWLVLAALALTAAIVHAGIHAMPEQESLPGRGTARRELVRVWIVSQPGGGEKWLKECIRAWEKTRPGATVYLRSVSAGELVSPNAVLPDLVLYTPGTVPRPQDCFSVLTGFAGLREPLLRAGRWQGEQYGLPLCYGAYALVMDAAGQPPAPTTLLGRPAATSLPTQAPSLPDAVLAPAGCSLFALGSLHAALTEQPAASPADVYTRFLAGREQAAMLTTGQITALDGSLAISVITPEEIVTDQVWFASLCPDAGEGASSLVRFLTSLEGQRRLSAQGLHTVREDLRLYVSGTSAAIESAAGVALTAINAYIPAADVQAAAWQYFTGREELSAALLPLI